ncbi:class I SAM-dependent methyltransferase [Mycobacterium szulgai]|uniref:Methyltransferase type 11 n=1 Tax=Mycobacterium szulgai TaxID=1787 RepID=A0A1X2E613_MYCSZ|nr:class I SAM-dependent methyltransferase [Mycobacterium szulgai]MCV7076495.1 class I SAM-dependent methyltransferase [Mycobacterium szulgai]ORW95708.1 methyltransferase type 11 [Mycobacterium szulgai]
MDAIETIATMPRGGPDASWLDRRFQTDALEYLDRDDVADETKQKVIRMLDRIGTRTKQHDIYASLARAVVSEVPSPRILEIGAGHGKLSAKILELIPTAAVTVSDVDPTSVANIAAGELGTNPRVRTQVIDATSIDAEDDSYDLVVFALAFHHLPPAVAYRAIAEATRVGKRFLVIDLKRRTPLRLTLSVLLMLPPQLIFAVASSSMRLVIHDGVISALRAYSASAFETLGRAVDPEMNIEFEPVGIRFPPSIAVVFSRSRRTRHG